MSSTSTLTCFVLALAIGYAFVFPAFSEVSILMEDKQGYEDSLKMVAEIENRKNELLTEFNNISETDKKNIETVLPDSLDYVKLVSDIDAVAALHGISIDKITKKELDSSVGDSIENAEPQKAYKSGIIGFSFVASHQRFNDFISNLETSLRILDIRSLKIEAQENGLYAYDIEFEAYWFK